MEENLYKAMYPTICTSPKFYELPNLHKTGTRSGLLYWAGAQPHMEWLKVLLRYLDH